MGMKPVYEPGEKLRGALMSGGINTGLAAALTGGIPLARLPIAYAAMTGASYANRTGTQQVMQREADRLAGADKLSAVLSKAQQSGTMMGGRSSRAMFGGGVLGAKRPNSLASTSSRPGRGIGQQTSFLPNSGMTTSGRMRVAMKPTGTAPMAKMTPMAPMASASRPRANAPLGRPMLAPASNPQQGARVALRKSSAPATVPGAYFSGMWRSATTPIRAAWNSRLGKAALGMGAAGLTVGGIAKAGQPVRRLQADNWNKLLQESSSNRAKQDLAAALWR
jgi:hypothetical protein